MNYSYYNNEYSPCFTKIDGFSSSFPFEVPLVYIMSILSLKLHAYLNENISSTNYCSFDYKALTML